MPITTLDGLLGAYKQVIPLVKTNSVTTVAGLPFTLFDRAGVPPAGSLNPSNTTNGIVPVAGNTGYPAIVPFQGGNTGYLSRVEVTASAAGSFQIYDVLFMAGQTTIPTSGTTTIALTSRPSFASRVPFQSDGVTRAWSRVELFLQASVAWSNHAHTASVDYLDQDGAASNTGNQSTQNNGVNRLLRCPLAAGDTGVSDVTGYNLNGVTSAAGAVSVMAARRLFSARTNVVSQVFGPDQTGMPIVYPTSALLLVAVMDSTSSAIPAVTIEIAEG
jgi:hypothetical protein